MSEMRGRQTKRETKKEEIMYSISQTPRSQNHKRQAKAFEDQTVVPGQKMINRLTPKKSEAFLFLAIVYHRRKPSADGRGSSLAKIKKLTKPKG